jgi:hypothetical protein
MTAFLRRASAPHPFPLVAMALVGFIVGIGEAFGPFPLPGDFSYDWLGGFERGGYVYPPVLTQLMQPLHVIDVRLVIVAWTVLLFASIGYVLRWWSFLACVLALVGVFVPGPWAAPVASAIMGNVTMPMVAAMVLGMRHPALWAVPLLTKITPGIGVLWFAFRREWRQFAIAVGTAAGLAFAFMAVDPGTWADFVRFALANLTATNNGPDIVGPRLWLRLPIAVLLVWFAARTDRPWLVPIAGATAIVGMYGFGTWATVALGAIPLALQPDEHGARQPVARGQAAAISADELVDSATSRRRYRMKAAP